MFNNTQKIQTDRRTRSIAALAAVAALTLTGGVVSQADSPADRSPVATERPPRCC